MLDIHLREAPEGLLARMITSLIGKCVQIVPRAAFVGSKPAVELSKPTIDKSGQAIAFMKPMIGEIIPAFDKLKQVSKNLKPTNEN